MVLMMKKKRDGCSNINSTKIFMNNKSSTRDSKNADVATAVIGTSRNIFLSSQKLDIILEGKKIKQASVIQIKCE